MRNSTSLLTIISGKLTPMPKSKRLILPVALMPISGFFALLVEFRAAQHHIQGNRQGLVLDGQVAHQSSIYCP